MDGVPWSGDLVLIATRPTSLSMESMESIVSIEGDRSLSDHRSTAVLLS